MLSGWYDKSEDDKFTMVLRRYSVVESMLRDTSRETYDMPIILVCVE